MRSELDLTVAMAPLAYPVPAVPVDLWSRLPDNDMALIQTAQQVYGCRHVLPVPGVEAGISALARLFQTWYGSMRVVLAEPAFEGWSERLRRANHVVLDWPADWMLDGQLPDCDVVIIGRPVNPTGQLMSLEDVCQLAARCREKGGWLVVDEAFIDAETVPSCAAHAESAHMIVLRSISPFFGLGGARVAFICAPHPVIKALRVEMGAWAVSGPALWAAGLALADQPWIDQQRTRLTEASRRLFDVWACTHLERHPCGLFLGLSGAGVASVHAALTTQGINTRLFPLEEPVMRCALPKQEADWERLALALRQVGSAINQASLDQPVL